LPALLPLVASCYEASLPGIAAQQEEEAEEQTRSKTGLVDEEGVWKKEAWRDHERERGEACMHFLGERFAGLDGAAALKHIVPWLLESSPCARKEQTRDRTDAQAYGGQDAEEGMVAESRAARLQALGSLVGASSRLQIQAYLPVVIPSLARALADAQVTCFLLACTCFFVICVPSSFAPSHTLTVSGCG
jgi:hypothetical protein